ncbi:MAG: hypothetical protein K5910_08715 [Bacteroidales bacterium]|nr:hypothetical protein [Bacteroidales bacterium]
MYGWRINLHRLLPVVLALGGLGACSVKEDRTECPVYVTVLTDRFLQQGLDGGIVSFAAAAPIKRDSISFLSYVRQGYAQACPRDYARVAVLSGLEHSLVSGEALEVLPGRQAGLVWAYGISFSAEADEYVVDAVPHKQYCLVHFLFDGSPTAPEGYPWRFRLLADCAGMNIYTLEPLPGDYRTVVEPNALGEWTAVLPRQRDNTMRLEVFLPVEGASGEEAADYVVDLGEAFAQQGYDWTREDLLDITVNVGFTSAGIALSVREWEGDDSYRDIEI